MQITVLEELKKIKALILSKSIKQYLSIRELEDYCGLSQSTIRREIQLGKLKVSRRKGKMLFSKDDVERWLSG